MSFSNFEVFGELKENGLPPIILLHGWGHSIEVTRGLANRLGAYTRVYALDTPGHGKSEMPDGVWGMHDFAVALKDFADSQNLSKVVLIGHSFGGKISMKFSDLFPSYVNRLVLIGSSGIRPKPNFKKKMRNLYLKILRFFLRRLRNTSFGRNLYENWFVPRYASRDYLSAGALRKTFVKSVNEDLYEELRSIETPTLLLWGENDLESPVSVAFEMKSLLKNSELIVVPGQGHDLHVGAGVSVVEKYIRDFLFKRD